MQPSRRAANLGIFAAVVVLTLSLSLIWARQESVARLMAEMDQPGPAFVLSEVGGAPFESDARLEGRITVLCFTSARCPASNKYKSRILELARQYGEHGVKFVAIHPTGASPSAIELDEIRVQSSVTGQHFPSLLDPGGHVAAAYGAAETPLFVVLDKKGRIRYRGTFDDSPDGTRVTERYVADTVRSLLAPETAQMAYTQAGGTLLR